MRAPEKRVVGCGGALEGGPAAGATVWGSRPTAQAANGRDRPVSRVGRGGGLVDGERRVGEDDREEEEDTYMWTR